MNEQELQTLAGRLAVFLGCKRRDRVLPEPYEGFPGPQITYLVKDLSNKEIIVRNPRHVGSESRGFGAARFSWGFRVLGVRV